MKKTESEKLISKFIEIHENKYNYSHVIYKNMRTKITIECPIHGLFEQTPTHHLRGSGCRKCANQIINVNNGKGFTQEKFIEIIESKNIPNLSFDKVIYQGKRKDIIVTCSIHGDYTTKAEMLLKGNGCPSCGITIRSLSTTKTTEQFISEAIEVHDHLYDYSLINYKGIFEKVKIICKKHNKIFIQTPASHLYGIGCPLCKLSKGELKVIKFLDQLQVQYIRQKTFSNLSHIRRLKFDFYLPLYNSCIEFDGEQHFRVVENYWKGQQGFNDLQMKDSIKNKYCELNNIPLLRIRFDNNDLENTIKSFIENLIII